MFCSKCGSKIPDGANFCPNCQAPVNGANANEFKDKFMEKSSELGQNMKNMSSQVMNDINNGGIQRAFERGEADMVTLICAVVGLMSAFLPAISFSMSGVSVSVGFFSLRKLFEIADMGFESFMSLLVPILVIVAGLIGIVSACTKNKLLTRVVGAVLAVVGVVGFFVINSQLGEIGMGSVNVGWSIYVMVLSGIAMIVSTYIEKK